MNLLKPTQMYKYQKEASLHQLYNPKSMLWLDMGLGKTVVTLSTIQHRMAVGQVKKTLIFGPVRVIHGVWERESRKWEHTKTLRCSVLSGTPQQRINALFCDADIYLCSYENMNWLANLLMEYYVLRNLPLPFQMVVYDEVSKMKNPGTVRYAGGKRTKTDKRSGQEYVEKVIGWKKVSHLFDYTTGLTGTPASNGYLDLFGQYLVVDNGDRLGKFITHYRDNYFVSDHMGWSYTPSENGKAWIEHNISDITIKMDAKDYLDIPESKDVNIMVDLPPRALQHYKEMEKQMFTELDSGTEVEVFSKNSISNKCLQICNGAAYYKKLVNGEEQMFWEEIHNAKLDALEDILEEAGGQPVLVAYTFRPDAERIMKRFKKYKPVNMTAEKASSTERIVNDWNSGKIKLLIGHPACLHPDTLVLTEQNGWTKLIDVQTYDKVFDGVEFVSHSGCMYAGYKETITVFDITMTPDHKVLINDDWVEGQHVDISEEGKRKAQFFWQKEDTGCSDMRPLHRRADNNVSKHGETQQELSNSLPTLQVPSFNRVPNLENMARNEASSNESCRQGLSWARDIFVKRVDVIREFLQGHVRNIRGPFNNRTDRREPELLKRELRMDNDVRPASKQANNAAIDLPRSENSFSGTLQTDRFQQNDVDYAIKSRDVSRRSRIGCSELALRKEQESEEHEEKTCSKTDVYDLIDCGPRHRFLIKNDAGEMFIVKNSMGHGVDGLQESGSTVVWFGLNWSLELYDQMNRRIDRNGQTKTTKRIRIMCNNTVDLAVADSLLRKHDDQAGLKDSIQRYRDGQVTANTIEIPDFM